MNSNKQGIIASGNWIIDHIKIVDVFPQEGTLANILSEEHSTGGSPANVLIALAKLGSNFPLGSIGKIGDDEDGKFILDAINKYKINQEKMDVVSNTSTSYTDVITVKDTGKRTFYHNRGANKLLGFNDFDFEKIFRYKIFHIGYILLLDMLDAKDSRYGTVMARLLKEVQNTGTKTSVDVVSEDSKRFMHIVPPSLKYTDYLIINEFEADKITGFKLRDNYGSLNQNLLKPAAEKLMKIGVRELVAIHMPEGSFVLDKNGVNKFQPSHLLDTEYIKGTAGAGDAFVSGMLYGIHEGYSLDNNLKLATATSATCLSHPTCTGGISSLKKIMKFAETTPYRK